MTLHCSALSLHTTVCRTIFLTSILDTRESLSLICAIPRPSCPWLQQGGNLPERKSPGTLLFGPGVLGAFERSSGAAARQPCTPRALQRAALPQLLPARRLPKGSLAASVRRDGSQDHSSPKQRSASPVITTAPSSPPAQLRECFPAHPSAVICYVSCSCGVLPALPSA